MGKPPPDAERASREKLDGIWRQICADADRRDCLTLRAAANIIGFCEFPLGWSWTEFKPWQFERIHDYEDKAKVTRTLSILLDKNKQNTKGKAAEGTAQVFRRRHVEQMLARLIGRDAVRAIIYDERNNGSLIDDKLRLAEGTKIDVERSSYGFPDLRWHCTIDAINLTKFMGERRWRHTRAKDRDWLIIERYIRVYFETYGCPDRKEDVYDAILANFSADKEPSSSMLKDAIADLRREYEDSD